MTTFLGAVGTMVALAGLLTGTIAHLTKPTALTLALRTHQVLPARIVPVTGVAAIIAEAGLFIAGLQAVIRGDVFQLVIALALTAALYGIYAAYATFVTVTGKSGPCGCSRADVPMDKWVAIRAAVFAACAITGALMASTTTSQVSSASEYAILALATAALSLALWQLPLAMSEPANGR